MKFLLSNIFLISLAIPAASQQLAAYSQAPDTRGDQTLSIIDTIAVRRNALTTAIYSQEGEKLSYGELRGLYYDTPAAIAPLKWSRPVRIAAPIAVAGGVVLGAIALKGTAQTAVIEGKTYHYTVRSKPKLAAGLVLLAGGLCLFEWSNDLLVKSAWLYNRDQIRKAGGFKAQVGVTEDGVGLVVKF